MRKLIPFDFWGLQGLDPIKLAYSKPQNASSLGNRACCCAELAVSFLAVAEIELEKVGRLWGSLKVVKKALNFKSPNTVATVCLVSCMNWF